MAGNDGWFRGKFHRPDWERSRVEVYWLPRALTDILRAGRGGEIDVVIASDTLVISPDPQAVTAVERLLSTIGLTIEYVSRPSGRTFRGKRAATYARDLAKADGVRRVPEYEADQAALRELLIWAEVNEGAVLGLAAAAALLPKDGDASLRSGFTLIRDKYDS
jgi:hypothetical protein